MPPVKRSVAGIAIEGERLFIARRKPGGDLGEKWEFPGGKAEAGESDEEALQREYLEEFGVPVRPGPCLGSASFEHRGQTFSLNAYRVYFETPFPENLSLAEHTQWQWALLGEIEGLDFAGSDRALFPGLKAYLDQQSHIQQQQAHAGLVLSGGIRAGTSPRPRIGSALRAGNIAEGGFQGKGKMGVYRERQPAPGFKKQAPLGKIPELNSVWQILPGVQMIVQSVAENEGADLEKQLK